MITEKHSTAHNETLQVVEEAEQANTVLLEELSSVRKERDEHIKEVTPQRDV